MIDRADSTIGSRLRELRHSIEAEGFRDKRTGEPAVPFRVMDDVYDAGNRWVHMEKDAHSTPDKVSLIVLPSLVMVLMALRATDTEREAAIEYVIRGNGQLPWSPANLAQWIKSPIKHGGRRPKPVQALKGGRLENPPPGPSGPVGGAKRIIRPVWWASESRELARQVLVDVQEQRLTPERADQELATLIDRALALHYGDPRERLIFPVGFAA